MQAINYQCCCQGLKTRGRGQDKDLMSRTRTRTWKLVLEDPQWQGLSSRTTTLLWGSALRSTWTWNLTGAQWQISHPFVTQSVQDDGAWYFACYVSLLNPRKFSRTWNFRGQGQGLVVRGQEQGQELEPQGRGQGLENWSSRILEDKDFSRRQQHC